MGGALATAFMLSDLLGRMRAFDCRQQGKADKKAYTLLKEWLSPEQLALFKSKGYFDVKGSHSGRRYRIRCGQQFNIDQLDAKGARVAVWCFGPAGNLPVGDIMLAQKVAIETNERGALAVANRGPFVFSRGRRRRWPRRTAGRGAVETICATPRTSARAATI
jgi:hypothetical protein